MLQLVYQKATNAFSLGDKVEDVFFQILGHGRRLRRLRVHGLDVSPWCRSWGLVCQVYRQNVDGILSRPFITLQTRSIKLSPWCKIEGEGRSEGHEWALQVSVTGHIRMTQLNWVSERFKMKDTASSALEVVSVQNFVDGILEAAIGSTVNKCFESPLAMSSTIKQGILSTLESAQFSKFVDFDKLETTITNGRQRRRFVASTVLNIDGSERLSKESNSYPRHALRSSSPTIAATRPPNEPNDGSDVRCEPGHTAEEISRVGVQIIKSSSTKSDNFIYL